MPVFLFFVFFPVSGSLCPSKVCLSFISFSATYFYLLLCPYFLFLGFFLSVNGLLLCFLICLYASSLLVNGTWSTFSHSALLSSSSDFSLYHGVCHTLSFRDLMPLDISSEDYLCFLSGIHAIFLLFSLFLLFPHCFFFLCLECISLHHWYRQMFCPAVDSGIVLSPFANNTVKANGGVRFLFPADSSLKTTGVDLGVFGCAFSCVPQLPQTDLVASLFSVEDMAEEESEAQTSDQK